MAGRQRRSERDRRRRSLGQNFLSDQHLVDRVIHDLDIAPGELVVDLGAGGGSLTLPLARAGARVWAVERDVVWADRLEAALEAEGLMERDRPGPVRIIRIDVRRLRMPREPFRVVANPPFGLTTELLGRLLDDPTTPLVRADLILQREVVRKHATQLPRSLKTAAWSPWWEFSAGRFIPRQAFRPRPSVDGAMLHVRRRTPAVLPEWLAPRFESALRAAWQSSSNS